jgi:hypothetical protein
MNIEELEKSLIVDLEDIDYQKYRLKQIFLNENVSSSDYISKINYMAGIKDTTQLILNRIQDEKVKS